MSVTLTFNDLSYEQAETLLSCYNTPGSGGVGLTSEEVPEETAEAFKESTAKPKRKRRTKKELEAENTTNVAEKETEEVVEEEAIAGEVLPAGEVSADDVRAALSKLNESKGIEEAKKALAEFDATRVSELKEENYGSFVAYCNSAV